MSTALIVGHPDLTASRVNAALAASAADIPAVDVRIVADLYPGGVIDALAEQAALSRADDVVLLYPTYWYSVPGPLKNWLDAVMTRGWAYGTGAPGALAGKTLRVVTTTGGTEAGYRPGELHSYEYDDILAPLRATAHRLGMRWRPPLVVHGVRDIDDDTLAELSRHFGEILDGIAEPRARVEAGVLR
ncbi:NAD(P)H-dependent oxidoreductase [Leifsonia sp. C5G2]|uniref:NAD(P)H-dependent oxidoreductase n=1 Tax=Leifsonia sp. C5G2 TaxID=2735269 RepID=UPI001584C856|nr:oxidoreductase [Leifsonia sp. C5G2]